MERLLPQNFKRVSFKQWIISNSITFYTKLFLLS